MAGRRGLLGLLGLGLALVASVVGVQVWSTGDRAPAPELVPPAPSAEPSAPSSRGTTLEPSSAVAGDGADPAPGPGARRAAGTPRAALSRPEPARGRVVEARTGLGVAGAEVTWREGERTTGTTSDADGRFELELAPGERASLAVRHTRFVDAVRPLTEAPDDELVLPLVRSATLEVRVDGAWDPATPPWVRVGRPGGPEEEIAVVAVRGRLAVLADLAPGDVHVGVVAAQGAVARREYVPLESGEETRISVALEPGTTLEGTVLLQGSLAGVVDAVVRLSSEELDPLGEGGSFAETWTGVGGEFRLEALPAVFTGTLTVEAPWGARLERAVAAGERPVRVRFPAPARLSGTVVDAAGAPVSASVALWRGGREEVVRRAASDAAGRFDLAEIPGGEKLELTASLEDAWGRAVVRVPHGGLRSDVELVLARDVEFVGRVLRASDDAPVAGATVRAASGPRAGAEATTAADGGFALALPEGKTRVEVSAPGYRSRVLPVRVSSTAEERVLQLVPALPLAGWVVDGDGWGVVGAHVQARKGKERRETRADTGGAFELDGLTPGRWVVSAWTRANVGSRCAPATIEVVEGVPLDPLRLELEIADFVARGMVAGEIVVAGSGEPVPGLEFPRGGRVALDGARFVLYQQAASDRYRLWARGDGVEEIWLPGLVLTPGARIEVGRLETRPTSRVRVRFTGAPIRRDAAKVALRRAEPPAFPWLRVPRQIELEWNRGAWEADGVGRYVWTLQVREGGALRHRERVEVRSRREELTVRLEPPGSGRGR